MSALSPIIRLLVNVSMISLLMKPVESQLNSVDGLDLLAISSNTIDILKRLCYSLSVTSWCARIKQLQKLLLSTEMFVFVLSASHSKETLLILRELFKVVTLIIRTSL